MLDFKFHRMVFANKNIQGIEQYPVKVRESHTLPMEMLFF